VTAIPRVFTLTITCAAFRRFSLFLLFGLSGAARAFAVEAPRGFFLQDLRQTPPVLAFFNLETRQLEPCHFRAHYQEFLDVVWDRSRGRMLFSARTSRQEPFRIFAKAWPDGDETMIYENPTGPFRFLLSPDGERLALQIMGPSAWPIIGVYALSGAHWTDLGQGYSPDWSVDGQRLLYLKIPGALPTWLYEYDVATDSATALLREPVMEAVYTDDANQIVLKTASQAKICDVFQLWNRSKDRRSHFSLENPALCRKKTIAQRELVALPGHRFFLFKESIGSRDLEDQSVVVMDVWGGRLQAIPFDDWNPRVVVIDETALAMSENPIAIVSADGAGGKIEIPQARFFRWQP
jgi:hypothetical protein